MTGDDLRELADEVGALSKDTGPWVNYSGPLGRWEIALREAAAALDASKEREVPEGCAWVLAIMAHNAVDIDVLVRRWRGNIPRDSVSDDVNRFAEWAQKLAVTETAAESAKGGPR